MKKRRFKRHAKKYVGLEQSGPDMSSLFKSNPFPNLSAAQSQGVSKILSESADLLNKYADFFMNADKENGLASETSICPAELLDDYAEMLTEYAVFMQSFYIRVVELFSDLEPSRGVKKFVAGYRTLAMVFAGSAKMFRIAAEATERIPETELAFVEAYGILSSSFGTFQRLHNDLRDEFILFLSRKSDDELDDFCQCEHCKPKPPQQGGSTEH